MSEAVKQALCCICGALRTFKRARNYRGENYWFARPANLDWERELGDLKCERCGRITTHALLHAQGDWSADHAERLTRIALGSTSDPMNNDTKVRDRIRSVYRQGRKPNPFLFHRWLKSAENAAREAGQNYVITHCGERHELPETSATISADEVAVPDPVQWDQEYEDPATGLWWLEMDCVDCLRVANERRIARRRELLNQWLAWVYAKPDERVTDDQVDTLIAALEATQNQKKNEDSTR